MDLFVQRLFDGVSNGAIYAAVAVAMVLIFKATTLINFAQGELAMIGAFFAYIFVEQAFQWPLWLSAIIAMVLTALLGMLIERLLLRPFDPADHLPVVLITLGIFYIVNAVAGDIWNYQQRIFPSLFPRDVRVVKDEVTGERYQEGDFVEIFGARLFFDTIGITLSLLLMLGVLYLILNKTKMGLAFRAVSSNTESSRLVGIRVGRVLSFGWALACAFGTLGAILVAPALTLQPNMMAFVLIYALAAAAFGGLDSVAGAAIGGVVVGLLNSVGLGYFTDIDSLSGFNATPLLPPLLLLLVTLYFRPSGLFGTKSISRV